jgi:anti-repressor protein
MSNIIPFDYSGNQIRVITVDGEPWWVAKDLMTVLGYKAAENNTTQILQRLDDDEKDQISISSNNNPIKNFQKAVWCVNEAGLYSLILWSQVPEAKNFRRWVTHEVIPSIRKTGGYQMPTYPEALRIAADALEKLDQAKNAVGFYEAVTASKDSKTMAEVAKILEMGKGRNQLFRFLREQGILRRNNEPYQKYIDLGWFRVTEREYETPDGEVHINLQTRVYQKGLDGIRRLLKKEFVA